jgi:hypothetical protein
MALGLPLATAALAAWLGTLIESPWISLGVAAALLVLPTLLLVDRLLPEDDPRKGRGIPTDVLSMVWLGVATLAFGPLAPFLHDPLVSLARRTAGGGLAVFLAEVATGPAETAIDGEVEGATDDEVGASDDSTTDTASRSEGE